MKRLIFSILIIFVASGIKAQNMSSLFVSMPDRLIPQLEDAWRKDLVELYNSGKEAKLKNSMNGYSALKKLTDNYLYLQTSENGVMELKLLPLVNDTEIIGMITTVNGPVPDSRISFYTTDWKPLATSDLFTPVQPEWFIKEKVDRQDENYKNVLSYLDMNLIKYSFSPDDLTLTATYTTPLYLSKEDQKKILPYLKDNPKIYSWEKYHFK